MLPDRIKAKAVIFGNQIRDFEDLGFDVAARETRIAWVRFCRLMGSTDYHEAHIIFMDAYFKNPTKIKPSS